MVCVRTVGKLRKHFVSLGFEVGLNGEVRKRRNDIKIDRDGEGHVIAVSLSGSPAGWSRWKLHISCGESG